MHRKLKPLKQWICDECHEVIERPKDGWVHWRRERNDDDPHGKVHDIRILHHMTASPRGRPNGCYPERMELDMHLHHYLGPSGIVDLLSMMDVGTYHDPNGRDVGKVRDIRAWVEIFRRLHVPYYEQGRLFFDHGRRDGFLDGINEIALYLPRNLKALVDEYAEGDWSDDDEEEEDDEEGDEDGR